MHTIGKESGYCGIRFGILSRVSDDSQSFWSWTINSLLNPTSDEDIEMLQVSAMLSRTYALQLLILVQFTVVLFTVNLK